MRSSHTAAAAGDRAQVLTLVQAAQQHGVELHPGAVGRGAQAVVYRGRVSATKQPIAVKCIDRAGLKPQQMERLVAEIDLLQRCSHQNIVRLHPHPLSYFLIPRPLRLLCIVTEWCDLGDLAHYTGQWRPRRQPTDPAGWESTCLALFRQLAAALAYLRAHDIVHMDIKPGNLLLATSRAKRPAGKLQVPMLKLADFGIAQLLRGDEQSERLQGTPLYMAPELVKDRQYGAEVDLWAAGAVLHELLWGAPPLHPKGSDMSVDSAVLRITAATTVTLPAPSPIASAQTIGMLRGLLQLDPTKRTTFDDFFGHPLLDLPTPAAAAQAATLADSLMAEVQRAAAANADGAAAGPAWAAAAEAAADAAARASRLQLEQLAW
eukprot:SAG22_NODE_629_length_8389_cov_6.069723_5_plen_377_part_00